MLARLRRFLDIRAGEVLPVALTFLYIAAVVAAFLLAKSIRNALYLKEYGAEALAYVYAAVPIAVSMFVPISNRIAARFAKGLHRAAVDVWRSCLLCILRRSSPRAPSED